MSIDSMILRSDTLLALCELIMFSTLFSIELDMPTFQTDNDLNDILYTASEATSLSCISIKIGSSPNETIPQRLDVSVLKSLLSNSQLEYLDLSGVTIDHGLSQTELNSILSDNITLTHARLSVTQGAADLDQGFINCNRDYFLPKMLSEIADLVKYARKFAIHQIRPEIDVIVLCSLERIVPTLMKWDAHKTLYIMDTLMKRGTIGRIYDDVWAISPNVLYYVCQRANGLF